VDKRVKWSLREGVRTRQLQVFLVRVISGGRQRFCAGAKLFAVGLVTATLTQSSSFGQDKLSGELIDKPEIVFNWSQDRCDSNDIPDQSIRAIRLAEGRVLAFDTHFVARRFLGPDLNNIKRDCTIIYKGAESADPSDFSDRTWIAAPWTDDGKIIYALSHNEYQGDKHKGHCQFSSYYECWYNTIGLLRSDDEGQSFERVEKKPIAAPAFRQGINQGQPRGFFGPSNIIEKDHFYYTIIKTEGGGVQLPGTCLFRAANPGDISSWTYFDGTDFVASALNPYEDDVSQVRPCKPLALRGSATSLARHQATGLFVAVTEDRKGPTDQIGTVFIATSNDLINWSEPEVLTHFPLAYAKSCSDPYVYPYATIIDPESSSRNFETLSDFPFLYLTRVHMSQCGMTENRDLIRIKLHLFSLR
jgi:hypothetical protein